MQAASGSQSNTLRAQQESRTTCSQSNLTEGSLARYACHSLLIDIFPQFFTARVAAFYTLLSEAVLGIDSYGQQE